MRQQGNDTITLPFNPTDDRLTDAIMLVKEAVRHFDLTEVEQVKVFEFCMPAGSN